MAASTLRIAPENPNPETFIFTTQPDFQREAIPTQKERDKTRLKSSKKTQIVAE